MFFYVYIIVYGTLAPVCYSHAVALQASNHIWNINSLLLTHIHILYRIASYIIFWNQHFCNNNSNNNNNKLLSRSNLHCLFCFTAYICFCELSLYFNYLNFVQTNSKSKLILPISIKYSTPMRKKNQQSLFVLRCLPFPRTERLHIRKL